MEYINIFIKSIFVDNMIFAFFLGMCSYLAVDDTEIGHKNRIPLWMFGMLY